MGQLYIKNPTKTEDGELQSLAYGLSLWHAYGMSNFLCMKLSKLSADSISLKSAEMEEGTQFINSLTRRCGGLYGILLFWDPIVFSLQDCMDGPESAARPLLMDGDSLLHTQICWTDSYTNCNRI